MKTLLLILCVLVPTVQSACPSGYYQMFGGDPDLSLSATCCKWYDYTPDGTGFISDNPGKITCANDGGYAASTENPGEYVATATCGFVFGNLVGGHSIDDASFLVGLDGDNSPYFLHYDKSTNQYPADPTATGFLVEPLTPISSTTLYGFNDVVYIRKSTTDDQITQFAIDDAVEGDAPHNINGFVCEIEDDGTFTRYADNCDCPTGYNHAGTSCVKFVAGSDVNWFDARQLCKADNEKADLLVPRDYYEQLTVTFAHATAPGEAVFLGWQDFYWEDQDFLDPDGLRTIPTDLMGLLVTASDSNTKDFAYSYVNTWIPNDAAGTEDGTYAVAGAMCQIFLDESQCAATSPTTFIYPDGCIQTYIFREYTGPPQDAYEISNIASAEKCLQEIKDVTLRGSRCAVAWFRNHEQCWAFLNCDSFIQEDDDPPSPLSPGIVIFVHNPTCADSSDCEELAPQVIDEWEVDVAQTQVGYYTGVASYNDCFDNYCKNDASCQIANFCGGDCTLYSETLADHNSPNAGPSVTHGYRRDNRCTVVRKVTCEEASTTASETFDCPTGYTGIADDNDPLGAPRCYRILANAWTTFGEAYQDCMADAESIGYVGAVGSIFTLGGSEPYDDLWTDAELTVGTDYVWTGTCVDGADGTTFVSMDYEENPAAAGLTPVTGKECSIADSGGANALIVQDVEGCTNCAGVLCVLYDKTILP